MTDTPSSDDFVLIGEVVAPFGVRGQIKVRSLTDNIDHLRRRVKVVYIGPKRQPYTLKVVHEHKPGLLVLTLEGVATREDAESLRRAEVVIPEKQTAPLAKDEYFIHQLYDLLVVTEDGQEIGRVREVLETGANEVLVVARSGQPDALIPMIRDVVQQLEIENRRVVVRLIEGLLTE